MRRLSHRGRISVGFIDTDTDPDPDPDGPISIIELLWVDSFGLPSGADAVKVLSCLSLEAFAKPFEAPGNRVLCARVQAGNAS
jgi:hypothetical protein